MAQPHRPWIIEPGRDRPAPSHFGHDRDGRRRTTEPEGVSPAAIVAALVVLALVLVAAGGWAIWRSERDEAALAEAAEELRIRELELAEGAADCPGDANCYYRGDGSLVCDCVTIRDDDTGVGWSYREGKPQAGLSWYNLDVADLPGSCIPGQEFVVVDAQAASDCSTGGGDRIAHCVCVGEHAYSSLATLVSE